MKLLAGIAGAFIFTFAIAFAQWQDKVYLPPNEAIVYGLIAAAGFVLMAYSVRARAMVVVDGAIIAALYFVIIPILTSALGRSPQKRAMADLRAIATAVEAYSTDFNAYPKARNLDELERQLVPTYIKQFPREDSWRNAYRYESWPQGYAVGSGGKNRHFEKASMRQYTTAGTQDPDCDIIYSNGAFVVYPGGVEPLETKPFDEATRLYRAGQYAEAVPLFEEHLKTHPNDALAQARIAICLGQNGRLEEALPHAKKAIELDPTDYQSRSNLGLIYEKLHRPEEGIEWERQADRIKPNDPAVLNNLGWVLMQAGHSKEAVGVLERAVRLAPKEQQYRDNLAQARKKAR